MKTVTKRERNTAMLEQPLYFNIFFSHWQYFCTKLTYLYVYDTFMLAKIHYPSLFKKGVAIMMKNYDKIIDAALDLFTKLGFHGTSTATIASVAGVSNGSLFHHFKTKEALINTVYITKKNSLRQALLDSIDGELPIKKTLKKLWLACANWYLNNPQSLIFFQMFACSPYIDNLTREEATQNFSFIETLIVECITNDILVDLHPLILVHSFYASTKMYCAFVNDCPTLADEYLTISFNMWWRSVANI